MVIVNRGLAETPVILDVAADNEQVAVWQKAVARAEEVHCFLATHVERAKRRIRGGPEDRFRWIPGTTLVGGLALATNWGGLALAESLGGGIPRGSNPSGGIPDKGGGKVLVERLCRLCLGVSTPAPVEDFAIRQQAGMNEDAIEFWVDRVCPTCYGSSRKSAD